MPLEWWQGYVVIGQLTDWLYLLIVLSRHSVSTGPCDILRYSCLRYTWMPSRAFRFLPPLFRLARSLKRGCIRSRRDFPFGLPPCAPIQSLRFFFFPLPFSSSQNASLVIFSIFPIFVRLIVPYPRYCNIVKIGSISLFDSQFSVNRSRRRNQWK